MSASSQAPVPDTLDLASLYLGSPAGRAHTVSLKLSEESGGNRKGTMLTRGAPGPRRRRRRRRCADCCVCAAPQTTTARSA